MSTHHDAQVDARQGGVVQIGTGKGLGNEARGRWITRRVIIAHEVVVDGLGDMHTAQRMAGTGRFETDDSQGIGGIVAADITKGVDAMSPQDLDDLRAVRLIGFVAGRAQRGGGRARNHVEIGLGFLAQIDEVLINNASYPMSRTDHDGPGHLATRLLHHAYERLIDHGGGSAALGDQDTAGWHVELR